MPRMKDEEIENHRLWFNALSAEPVKWRANALIDEVRACHRELGRLTEQANTHHHISHEALRNYKDKCAKHGVKYCDEDGCLVLSKKTDPPIRFEHMATMLREGFKSHEGPILGNKYWSPMITYDLLMRGPGDKLYIVSKETGEWVATVIEPKVR